MGLDVSGGKTTKTFLLTPVILLLSLSSNIISETINMDGTDMKYLRILHFSFPLEMEIQNKII
jgi:hypothetical protein